MPFQHQMSFWPLCVQGHDCTAKKFNLKGFVLGVLVFFSARPHCLECGWHNLELRFSHSSGLSKGGLKRGENSCQGLMPFFEETVFLRKHCFAPVTNPPHYFLFSTFLHFSFFFPEKIVSQEAVSLGRNACGPQLVWSCSPSSTRNALP